MTPNELTQLLEKHSIDTAKYGVGSAKTLAHLLAEIESGETILVEEGPCLIRHVSILDLDVFIDFEGERLTLYEDRQVFSDGRIRHRKMPSSLGEKLYPKEDPVFAIPRALHEELGVRKFTVLCTIQASKGMRFSQSYPDLNSEYSKSHAEVLLDASEYQAGYREVQTDKTTYFLWRWPKEQ